MKHLFEKARAERAARNLEAQKGNKAAKVTPEKAAKVTPEPEDNKKAETVTPDPKPKAKK